jgi:hypothetical protein
MHSSSPPFVLHALPISSSLTQSFRKSEIGEIKEENRIKLLRKEKKRRGEK